MNVFDLPGPVNTEDIVRIIGAVASRYKYIVVASATGISAIKIARAAPRSTVVCVTWPQGAPREPDVFSDYPELSKINNESEMTKSPKTISGQTREILEDLDVKIVEKPIFPSDTELSFITKLRQIVSQDAIVKTLGQVSPGTLVIMECVMMAVDAGAVPDGIDVLACAGTGRGLDTAWVIKTAGSSSLDNPESGIRFVELLAKPAVAP
jgi:hypothetical protein